MRLLTNFTWWVNRKDPDGRNLFQGGFLGLDNIGIFDRSRAAARRRDAAAGRRHGVDGPLLPVDAADRDRTRARGPGLQRHRAEVRPPLRVDRDRAQPAGRRHAAVGRGGRLLLRRDADAGRHDDPAEGALAGRAAPAVRGDRVRRPTPARSWSSARWPSPSSSATSCPASPTCPARTAPAGGCSRWSTTTQLRQILTVMLDEDEFLGPHGIRAISRRHLDEPYGSTGAGSTTRSAICRRSPTAGMFGGNSNWRGPVWFPMNLVIMRALFHLHRYYGDEFKVECPTGSGRMLNLRQVAIEIGQRLVAHVPARRRRAAAGVRRDREVPDRPALARPDPVPRVLPRRQRRRARRRATRPGGRAPSRCCSGSSGDDLRDQHRGVAAPGARLDEVSWDGLPAGRRGVADGRVAAQPGGRERSRARDATRELAERPRT